MNSGVNDEFVLMFNRKVHERLDVPPNKNNPVCIFFTWLIPFLTSISHFFVTVYKQELFLELDLGCASLNLKDLEFLLNALCSPFLPQIEVHHYLFYNIYFSIVFIYYIYIIFIYLYFIYYIVDFTIILYYIFKYFIIYILEINSNLNYSICIVKLNLFY